jgi:alpha-1,6-mannosyltransferase
VLVGDRTLRIGVSIGAILVPVAACAHFVRDQRAEHRPRIAFVALAIGAVLVLAVLLPPHESHDVWSYVVDGRMVERYGVSPYTHVPRDFPHDPFYRLVDWRATPSVYGPVFVAIAAAGSRLAGASVFVARLYHQLVAAGALAVALVLIWRRTHDATRVAVLGLNPLMLVSVVNGAHNDALVGAAVLGATYLTEDRHWRGAGVLLALAALVKVTALLALPALVFYAAHSQGWPRARQVALAAIGVVGAGYAVAGPAALRALGATRGLMTRTSVWRLPRALLSAGPGAPRLGFAHFDWVDLFTLAGFAAIGSWALLIGWARRAAPTATDAVAISLLGYLVAAVYVLPWYAAWALPVSCAANRRATAGLAVGLSTFLLVAYTIKERARPGVVGNAWWWLDVSIGPLVALVAFVAVAAGKVPFGRRL